MSQLSTNTDVSKIFVFDNRYKKYTFTNGTGAILNLLAGMLVGRIGATQEVALLASAAVDGSQYPKGIIANDRELAIGETVTISVCIAGDVVKSKVIYQGADTAATLLTDDRSLEDHIESDTAGIILVESTELTGYDNA